MILAYHVIFGTYGFWLPNDPRGSWSKFVGSHRLYRYGPATTVAVRRSVATVPHDSCMRVAAKHELKYPPVLLDDRQQLAVGRGFAEAVQESAEVIYACAVMPDHVHLVVARGDRPIERSVSHLKSQATQQLNREGLSPPSPSPWARGLWKVFLDSRAGVDRAVRYVHRNPIEAGLPRQEWPFVQMDQISRSCD